MTDEESIESKKKRMRKYIAADRKFEGHKDKVRRGRKGGCLFGLLKAVLFVCAIGFVGYLVWLWHPWAYEHDERDALEHPGICSPGVSGTHTTDHLTIFGVRVTQTGESVICVE